MVSYTQQYSKLTQLVSYPHGEEATNLTPNCHHMCVYICMYLYVHTYACIPYTYRLHIL